MLALAAVGAPSDGSGLLLISVDGLNPDYVIHADRYGVKVPHLRRIMHEGSHASGVRGVLPTVTYPTHTTMLTGVSPAIRASISAATCTRNLGSLRILRAETALQP